MGKFADRLVARIQGQQMWPHPADERVWKQCAVWVAMRESEREDLRRAAKWHDASREYLVDPLPEKISAAFAELNFGEEPIVTPADPADKAVLEDMLDDNDLDSELQRWAEVCSSEGEIWWRVCADNDGFAHPVLEFWSRLDVIPLFVSGKLKAVAFIDLLDGDGDEVWRHFEVVDGEHIRNVLFVGTHDTVGAEVALSEHESTEDLEDETAHNLPLMPAGRVPNQLGKDVTYGRSDYAGIEDYVYSLNEALTIGRENARLTLKKRVVVPASAVDEGGNLPVNQEAIVVESADLAMGKDSTGSSQFKVLEYSFDADNLIKYQNSLAEAALTRVGITPSYIGINTNQSEGRAITGTALRLRLLPSTNAAKSRAAFWDKMLPRALLLMQILDARPVAEGGFGIKWAKAGEVPGVERGNPLPNDEVEEAQRHSVLVGAALESVETALRSLHPSWEDKEVQDEYERIKADVAALKPGMGASLFGNQKSALPAVTR